MGSVSNGLYELVEETLGCELIGMQVTYGDEIIAEVGRQDECAYFIEIPGNCFKASICVASDIKPNDKELSHIKKIFNIFSSGQTNTANRIFCGAEILETITDRCYILRWW